MKASTNKITSSITTLPDSGPAFDVVLSEQNLALNRAQVNELQINLGKLCNQACHHCHVDAGPKRTELMTLQTINKILDWLQQTSISKVDLTGGAPELNPYFRYFCDELIKQDITITSRCNITVLYEPGQEDLAQWYADRDIRLVCSLPCYTQDNVDEQRGKGTFDASIKGLQLLNSLGYGKDKQLDLVYNPNGAFLPPEQASLEQDYRQHLADHFDIVFSSLLTITNLPVNRFAHALKRDGELEDYQTLLVDNFNADTVPELMCRHLINIDWQGKAFDCDFNQMLDIPLANETKQYVWQLDSKGLTNKSIATDRHCFGCTAGAGSSCSGALS